MTTERNDEESLDLTSESDVSAESSTDDSVERDSRPEDQAILDALKASGLDDDEAPDSVENDTDEESEDDSDNGEENEEPEASEEAEEDPADEETSEEVQADTSDSEDAGDEEAEEAESDEDEPDHRIPYNRFQEVVRERNALKADAEVMRTIRKAAEERGWDNAALKEGLEMLLNFKNSPGAYKDVVKQMAVVAGLRVEESLPPNIQQAVDNGDISEEYAMQLAAQQQSGAKHESFLPDMEERGYTEEQGSADVNEVASQYRDKYPDIFNRQDVAKEAQDELAKEFKLLTAKTGVTPLPDRWADIASEVCERVAKRHIQPVKKPSKQPLRSSGGTPKRSKPIKSVDDVLDQPYMRAAFGD